MRKSILLISFFMATTAGIVYLVAQAKGLANVTFVKGTVQILRSGTENWISCEKNMVLGAGDKILTGEDGKAVFVYGDMSVVKLRPDSVCEPLPMSSGISGVKMPFGAAYVKVNPQEAQARGVNFELEGSKAIAGVRGTIFSYEEPLDRKKAGIKPRSRGSSGPSKNEPKKIREKSNPRENRDRHHNQRNQRNWRNRDRNNGDRGSLPNSTPTELEGTALGSLSDQDPSDIRQLEELVLSVEEKDLQNKWIRETLAQDGMGAGPGGFTLFGLTNPFAHLFGGGGNPGGANFPTRECVISVLTGIVNAKDRKTGLISELLELEKFVLKQDLPPLVRKMTLDEITRFKNQARMDTNTDKIKKWDTETATTGGSTSTTTSTSFTGDPGLIIGEIPRTEVGDPAQVVTIGGTLNDAGSNPKVTVNVNGTDLQASVSGTSYKASYTGGVAKGQNKVTVTVTRVEDQKSTSTSDSFLGDSSAPTLVVSSPVDNQTVGNTKVNLSGTIIESNLKTAEFKVNDNAWLFLPVNGTSFNYPIELTSGRKNTIQVRAVDKMGNQSITSIISEVDKTLEVKSGGKTGTIEIRFKTQ